jgi:hypothetical protein
MAIGNQHRQIGSLPNRLTSYATVDTRVARQTAVHNNMERTRISIDEPLPPLHRHPAGRSARLRGVALRSAARAQPPATGAHTGAPAGLPRSNGPTGRVRRPTTYRDMFPRKRVSCLQGGRVHPFFAERLVNAGGCVVL